MVTKQTQESFGEKTLSTGYKVSGWHLRLKAIGFLIFGLILLILGIIFSIILKSPGVLIISVFGIFALISSWLYWRRARSLVQGRFY